MPRANKNVVDPTNSIWVALIHPSVIRTIIILLLTAHERANSAIWN